MRLSGSQASTMATAATVYKSKPIHIEFKVAHGDNASTIADNMVKAVRFFQQISILISRLVRTKVIK